MNRKFRHRIWILIIIALMIFASPANLVFADTTGQHSALSVTGWTNPQNSTVSDNVYTTALLYSGQSPGALVSKNFGFTIPDGSTINGIVVSVERMQRKITSIGNFTDSMACLIINGTPNFNANRAVIWTAWATAEETKIFGSSTDTWGLNLTPADINNSGFGFYLSPIKVYGQAMASVDYIGITIYYTLPIPDTTPPVIAAQSDITAEATSSAGAIVNFVPSATDNVDTVVNVISNPVSGFQFPLGTTPVTLNATDIAGNAAIPVTFNVIVQDTTPPVIILNGTDPLNINQDTVYAEPGAVWTDAVDGTGSAVVGGATVNTAIPGAYTVTYNYTDAAGNPAAQVTRTVNVLDTQKPVIGQLGDITVEATSSAGAIVNFTASATDNVDATVTVISSPTTGSQFPLGTTLVTSNATDAAGNIADPMTFNVIVQDTTAPVITLNGTDPLSVPYGVAFVDPQATWTDAVDGTGTINGVGTLDILTPGNYTLTYNYTDAAGNPAITVQRTVTVLPWSTINVTKNVLNWKGNEVIDPTIFVVQKDGGSDQNISETTTATYDRLSPGTYLITEITNNKFVLSEIIGDNDGSAANGASITVGSGDVVNLTFVNWVYQPNKKIK